MYVYINDVSSYDFTNLKKELKSLPKWRVEKINSLKMDKDKQLSFVAGVMLRNKLIECGYSGEDNNVIINEMGKEVPTRKDLDFSISHSGTKVMLAIDKKPIGCDIQIMDKDGIRIARTFFTASENRILDKAENQKEMFYRIWTIKEAVLKMEGSGLSQSLRSFDVVLRRGKFSIKGKKHIGIISEISENYAYSVAFFK